MNANGYGSKMRNVVEEVYAVSIDGEIDKVYGWDDLHYGESDSVFMHNGDVIYGVKLHLAMGDSEKSRQKWMTIRNPAERSSPWKKKCRDNVSPAAGIPCGSHD